LGCEVAPKLKVLIDLCASRETAVADEYLHEEVVRINVANRKDERVRYSRVHCFRATSSRVIGAQPNV
jgi:hypothetical protein